MAVALTDADVVRDDSDLRHVAVAATGVDVLIARQDPPGPLAGTSPMDAEDYPDDDDLDIDGLGIGGDVLRADPGPDGTGDDPAGARLHRLGLRWTVQDRDEPDLVAAMCELVGFDPDDRVFLLAPSIWPGTVADPEVTVVRRAVRRVARVYGLPVLQYRRVSDEDGPPVEMPAPPLACGS
ncbi:MAG: hypothetical protein ABW212_00725 [Pseudonocardia sediminis]